MKKYFSIGETAKINNVSIQALRLYDKMGLLKPAYVDPKTNYRYYTIDQFMYIDLIKYSKHIGAPLKELNDVLHSKDVISLLAFIKKQQKKVEAEIFRLNKINKVIGHIEDKIKYAVELKETNEIYFRKIEKRYVVNTLMNESDEESDVEIKLRNLDRILEENDIMFEGETGYFVNMDLLLSAGTISYSRLYTTLYEEDIKNMKIDFKEIPDGKFLCISYFNNEREIAVEKLRKYINENNIQSKGIGVEVQLFNTLEQIGNDNSIYELQILT